MTEAIAYIKQALKDIYPTEEISSMTRLIIETICNLKPHQLLLDKDKKISPNEKKQIEEIVERLKQHEPLQYILRETIFYDLVFTVNSSVLIPRPETEELVELIIKRHSNTEEIINILDIGTGSGCIAISLAKNLSHSNVSALDVSENALLVAKENATKNDVPINFIHSNILDMKESTKNITNKFDIIVSNPPYVMNSEKEIMNENVLNHEPHLALFVSDNDPLLFYRTIAQLGKKILNPNGSLYFEINPLRSKETVEMLEREGYQDIEIIRDLSNKNRIASARV